MLPGGTQRGREGRQGSEGGDSRCTALPPWLDFLNPSLPVLLVVLLQGQVAVPSAGELLPEDVAAEGVALTVDTHNGLPLQVSEGLGAGAGWHGEH